MTSVDYCPPDPARPPYVQGRRQRRKEGGQGADSDRPGLEFLVLFIVLFRVIVIRSESPVSDLSLHYCLRLYHSTQVFS
jgi:hypothetical protein